MRKIIIPVFNNYDMLIILAIALQTKLNEKVSVSRLQNEVGLAYKNFLPHLKKLEKMGLIIIKDYGKGKKKEIELNISDLKSFVLIKGVLDYFLFDSKEIKDKRILEKDRENWKKTFFKKKEIELNKWAFDY